MFAVTETDLDSQRLSGGTDDAKISTRKTDFSIDDLDRLER